MLGSPQGAAFIGQAPQRGAPLELVLPQPPPQMPLPNPRTSLTELSRGSAKHKRVALTFDDGPHPEFTSQLLAILDHYHAKGTFFIVGVQAQKYPQWVKMIHQAGHEVANHTYDHFRLPDLPAEEQAYQIDECTRLLEQLTGTTPRFLRPPGGRYDQEIARLLRQRGMVLALWDVGLNDTAEDREAADLLTTASQDIRPGSVVLGHDGIQATIDMLPRLIETLQRDGYELVTMSELAAGE
jgi:peptidoglycan/xylan/chitin deacetylase (PgdA/CDA1 family)